MSTNLCIFHGNLGKDPEIKRLSSGSTVCNFSIACGERYTDRNGDKKEHTEWVNVVSYGKQAEVIERFFHKGSEIMVQTKKRDSSWDDRDGNRRYKTEFILQSFDFCGPKDSNSSRNGNTGGGSEDPWDSPQGGGDYPSDW